jgi:hypothetical protein
MDILNKIDNYLKEEKNLVSFPRDTVDKDRTTFTLSKNLSFDNVLGSMINKAKREGWLHGSVQPSELVKHTFKDSIEILYKNKPLFFFKQESKIKWIGYYMTSNEGKK